MALNRGYFRNLGWPMKFLAVHADDLGKRSTADLDVLLTET